MPINEGERDDYLRKLRLALQERELEFNLLRLEIKAAQFENLAQAALSADENLALANAGIVDKSDLAALLAQRDNLILLITAIKRLAASVRALN